MISLVLRTFLGNLKSSTSFSTAKAQRGFKRQTSAAGGQRKTQQASPNTFLKDAVRTLKRGQHAEGSTSPDVCTF